MNLTPKRKARIVRQFKQGRSMKENDRFYMLKVGTTERLVREALRAQDGDDAKVRAVLDTMTIDDGKQS